MTFPLFTLTSLFVDFYYFVIEIIIERMWRDDYILYKNGNDLFIYGILHVLIGCLEQHDT